MRSFSEVPPDIPALVNAFFSNDPYYPRPFASDPLYMAFKRGYMLAYGDNCDHGLSFLKAVEEEALLRSS